MIQNIETTSYGSIDIVECQITGKKYIAKSLSKNASSIRIHQFHTEVDVLSQLNDPYIPELLDAWETETDFVFVESYIKGTSLKECMNEKINKKMKDKIVLECMNRIQKVHEIGYLYLDLKPENIIVNHEDVYLIDFNSCVFKNAKMAYMASSQNQSQELNLYVSKNETSDIYALGILIKQLYGNNLWLKAFISKCTARKTSHRFKNIESMKKAFIRIFRWKRILSFWFVIILSVFTILNPFHQDLNALESYQNNANPETFFQAYLYTLNQLEGSRNEKLNQNLYQWIEEDWIDSSLYKNNRTMRFLVQQAIQSENPNICEFIEKKVNENFKKEYPYDFIILQMYANQFNQISYSFIHKYFDHINKMKESKERVIEMNQILFVLLNGKIVLEENEKQTLLKQIYLNFKEMNEEQACLFLEYCLFLKSRNLKIEIPEEINTYFEHHDQWKELYALYMNSNE